MGLLDKFDSIVISNDTRITEADKTFCEEQQAIFNRSIEIYQDILPMVQELNNLDNDYDSNHKDNPKQNLNTCLSYSGIPDIKSLIQKVKDNFVYRIFYYFSNTYQVSVDSDKMLNKESVTNYNEVIDNIFFQLDGYNFQDKAEKELKERIRQATRVGRGDKLTLNKTKISIDNFFWLDQWDKKYGNYNVSYNSDENFESLFTAFSYFLYKKAHNCFGNLYNIITKEKNDDIFKVHDIANNGILTLKLFKNGKIEIVFSSTEYAREFAKQYCNYTEEAQTA